MARSVLRVELPLHDKDSKPLHFSRADSVQRHLHQLDRDLGTQLEVADPQVANPQTRDRYIIHSLAEEAITSSQLEGASATRRVAKEMLLTGRAPQNRDELMIANNFRAMEHVRTKRDEKLTPGLILELHEILTSGTLQTDKDVGRFRRHDETVAVYDLADGGVLHMPPEARELPARIKLLCDFAND
jgi:Fic family protein